MDLNIITIAAAAVSAILAAVSLYRSNDVKTKADEVGLLRGEVERLHKELESQEVELAELRHENSLLYHVLRNKGIDVETEMARIKGGVK
jgi:SMC interacting uncharacterized protein involved in chromosome segregation